MLTIEPGHDLITAHGHRVAWSELSWSASRSSGPGGQNVNKVNSRVTLRWTPLASASLNEVVRIRVVAKLATQLTNDGELIISSDEHRDQRRNLTTCMERLAAVIDQAAAVAKKRRPTRPSRGSQERRLADKKRQQANRQSRRWNGSAPD